MKKIWWRIIWGIVAIFFVLYKFGAFSPPQNRSGELFFPVSYEQKAEFTYLQNDSQTERSGIEKYMRYCHKQKKLCTVLPHQSRRADYFWLKGIQIAWGRYRQEYQTGLNQQLQKVTNLNPYRDFPYIFAQLIVPTNKENQWARQFWIDAANFGEQWIYYLCDQNQTKCTNFRLPSSLGFTYFYYLQQRQKAIEYYKLAANSPQAPSITSQMPAMIAGRFGQHLVSASMWSEKIESTTNTEEQIFFLNKALMEYTLFLISESYNNQTICNQNLSCLQKNNIIKATIQSQIDLCEKDPQEILVQTQCFLLRYGLLENFITLEGVLVYPLEENMMYGWRPDLEDRRILPIE